MISTSEEHHWTGLVRLRSPNSECVPLRLCSESRCRFGSAAYAELAQDVANMDLHGYFANEKLMSNFPIGLAGGE